MSKKREIDELLTQVYNKHEGPMQEITFLNSIFAFINRRSNVLAQPGVTKQITNVLQKHIDAKKKELETQKQEQSKEKKNVTNEQEKETTKKVETQEKPISIDANNNNNNNSNNENNNHANKNDTNKDVEITDKTENKSKENEKKETEKKPKQLNDDEEADSGSPPPVGNGGKTDRYVWTQTLYETEMKLKVPSDVVKKDLDITFQSNKVFVRLKKTKEVLLDGEPNGSFDPTEASWTLDQEYGASYKTLTLILPKKQRDLTWWSSAIKGDPEINTRKVQPENSKLQDLDDDTRVTVEKMMFDQQQKMMGKPTSKELEQQEMLEKFKRAHPEFDFSQLNK